MPVAMGRHRGTGGLPPAAANRVLYDRVTIVVLEQQPHRSPIRHRPVRWGAPKSKVGIYEEKFPTWKSLVTENGYMKPGVASEHRGGAKGYAATISGPEFGKRDPPSIVPLTHFRH